MTDGVYKVIELIGTSANSWEEAASSAVAVASESLEDLRVAEVIELDMKLDGITNKVVAYRAKIRVSFRYHKD
jgi:dodecin